MGMHFITRDDLSLYDYVLTADGNPHTLHVASAVPDDKRKKTLLIKIKVSGTNAVNLLANSIQINKLGMLNNINSYQNKNILIPVGDLDWIDEAVIYVHRDIDIDYIATINAGNTQSDAVFSLVILGWWEDSCC